MSLRSRVALVAALAVPLALVTQVASAQTAGAAAKAPPAAEQIAAAILALPKEMQANAGVMGYRTPGKLEMLRPAKNDMLCLADDPADDQFHVSCYHTSMEPFMARGRALREGGTKGAQVDTARFAEVKSGKLKMPTAPASLYQIFGPKDAFDPATGTVSKSKALIVVYVPFATEATTGLSARPSETKPWLMFPGTPKAHIMFSSSM
ncbi:MAG: hypothetical protein ABIW79_05545 [Gemmatimonas sp.]